MTSFVSDVSNFAKKATGKVDSVVRKVVLDIGTRIVERSPVGDADYWKSPPPPGYVGGRFRANWQYRFGTIPSGEVDKVDPSGKTSIADIQKVFASPSTGIHYIANNLPYAKRLEQGWSRQAPSGMVALTMVEFQGIFNRAVK